ncbi:hypothetical protein UFOVP998_57 [uncultured Caudovirales phage]|uniref:HTH_XRE domain containing protein n=1 Tax=uncultured Caudovirales phage TaxID=2100421 RepID=A0A6J5RX63_9CAUD|nr:hypothetical protein UFOVP998_57 [uncultured Caudovirales phage]CAB4198887.1 hypothetical protein UFOVP1331_2 [uncultured Caudovirales phage]CAB4212565.1 hypothetical protein UFOVP1442_11 [uncultured Caudovirales phage]CAB5228073.1 hypothetical protein UFOVP1535_40 [uncultured Caudovirales phage]
MPKPLTPEQLTALLAVPLVGLPNKVRLALAMTNTAQTEVVADTGLSAHDVSKAVTGKGVTSVETARLIARFFVLDVEQLFPEPHDESVGDRRQQERRTGDECRSHEPENRITAEPPSSTEAGEGVANGARR